MPPIKILISARDPSSAKSLKVVVKKMLEHPSLDLYVILQNPAFNIFSKNSKIKKNVKFIKKVLPTSSLEKKCLQLFNLIQPDVVLTGISGPDDGLDEIIIKIAFENSVKSYSLQSFWGHVNVNLGYVPDNIFVIDEYSKILTQKNVLSNVIVSGIPAYEIYDDMDLNKLYQKNKKLSINKNFELKVCFYSQPFFEIKGYKETILNFIEELNKIKIKTIINYRPHPKETAAQTKWSISKFNQTVHFFEIDRKPIEDSLMINDAIVSIFSTCSYDLQQLQLRCQKTLGVSIFLLFNKDMFSWYKKFSGLDILPIAKSGSIVVKKKKKLSDEILRLTNVHEKEKLWNKENSNLYVGLKPSQIIINKIISDNSKQLGT